MPDLLLLTAARMDDAWNHRGKDVVTSPNGWSKLEERLNITLPVGTSQPDIKIGVT